MAKPKFQIDFHPEAIREIREAIEWYRQRDERVASELRELVAAAEALIQRSPEAWAAYLHGTRGFRFQKFPFVLAYVIRGETIFIIALAHTRLRPGYWRQRLD